MSVGGARYDLRLAAKYEKHEKGEDDSDSREKWA
jgi:hypothetical protein